MKNLPVSDEDLKWIHTLIDDHLQTLTDKMKDETDLSEIQDLAGDILNLNKLQDRVERVGESLDWPYPDPKDGTVV